MRRLILPIAALAALAGVFVAPLAAQACIIDGKATAYANGSRAVLSHINLTTATARTWALFSFPSSYHAGAPIRFSEDQGALRRVLPADDLRSPWHWQFGDGATAVGWSVVHRYTHPGAYRITVLTYYPSLHRYYAFDTIHIVISGAH